jgi:predicted RNase H-like HicB family nuclease
MRYAVVIEKARKNYSVYVPDVPGCVSVGDTVQEALVNIREALSQHFDGMREDGDPIPDPTTHVAYVDAETPAEAAGPSPSPVARPPRRERTRVP